MKFEASGTDSLEQFDQINFDKREDKRKGAYFFESIGTATEYLLEIATINRDALPIYMN